MVAAAGVWIFLAITGALALGLLWWGFRSLRRKRLLENVPTSKVKGVFLGLNEVKGRAHRDEPFTSYLARRHCVYYRYEVKERWETTERYTDSEGRSRTRTNSGWKTVASHEERQPFQLIDRTGALRIVPRGAEIQAKTVFDQRCGRHDPLYHGKGPSRSVANSDHRRHFVEQAIPLDARIYVLGPARLRDDKVEPEIAYDRNAELFLISTKGERQLTRVFALAEAYPDLDADENFAQLQRELVNTEDKIALAREFFNASVTALNTRIETLPDVLLAKLGRFKRGAFFAARGFEPSPVRLSFDD